MMRWGYIVTAERTVFAVVNGSTMQLEGKAEVGPGYYDLDGQPVEAGALDEFNESDHPRAPDGKFTSGAGGGSSGGKSSFFGGYEHDLDGFEDAVSEMISGGATENDTELKDLVKENPGVAAKFAAKYPVSFVANILKANAQPAGPPKTKKEIIGGLLMKDGGTTVKEVLAATGWPAVSMPQQAAAAGLKLTKIKKGGETFYTGTPMTAEEKAALKKGAVAAKADKEIQKQGAQVVAAMQAAPAAKPAEAAPSKPTIPAMNFGEPTPAELEKAKKNVALQMGYVPGPKPEMAGGEPMKSAEALLKVFNDKWAGKNIAADPAQLKQKVNDFKALGVAMKALKEVETKKHAEIAAQAKAAQAEQAKKLAEKAAADAKAAAEKNKEFMDGLGVGEDQAEGLFALAKMLGQSNSDLVLAFKSYEAKAKGFGYPISGIEAATIMSYSNGSYGSVNKALREGSWTPQQHMYVSMVNKALTKMPKHTGNEKDGTHLIRNTHLSPEEIAYYAEGKVIQEKALMSTSTKKPNGVFSGNVRFLITSKGKRGASIKKLSHYGSEDEVIFKAKTFFKVNKVENKSGGSPSTIIHLEEWEDFD